MCVAGWLSAYVCGWMVECVCVVCCLSVRFCVIKWLCM